MAFKERLSEHTRCCCRHQGKENRFAKVTSEEVCLPIVRKNNKL
jgi:hypothetical protein